MLRKLVGLCLVIAMTIISISQVNAQNPFPQTPEEVLTTLGAEGFPVQVIRETVNGWEVHFQNGGDLAFITGPVCIDWDPTTSMIEGNYRVFQDVSSQWQRIQVPEGSTIRWWGFQISLYWFFCSPVR